MNNSNDKRSFNRRQLIAAAGATMLASQAAGDALAQTGSPSGAEQKTQKPSTIRLERPSRKISKVIFSNPPVNLIGPETVSRLHEVITELTADSDVQVVIFSSDVPEYFFNHFDLSQAGAFPVLPDADKTPAWVDLVLRLSNAPFISIASIRGRTRGGGHELALACDLRYASRQQAKFGQPEVGAGIVPGGGASERLPRVAGRDRALEVILSSNDYDADLAERYGFVTRTLDDADLDGFVDGFASRLASFDKQALAAAKAQINRASLPPDADLQAAYAEYTASLKWPEFLARRPKARRLVAEKGFEEFERNMGHYLGIISQQP